MRGRSIAWLAIVAMAVAACTGDAAPTASDRAAGPCAPDLPPRTSPTDYPVAVLHVEGQDLPPVVGPVEWLGGPEPVLHEPPLRVNLERFTVLTVRGQPQVSLRTTDAVSIAAWTVDAVPDGIFRSGDFESDRVRWDEGSDEADVVCVPIQDGQWTVIADITFAEGAGTGTYYWRLNISQTPGA